MDEKSLLLSVHTIGCAIFNYIIHIDNHYLCLLPVMQFTHFAPIIALSLSLSLMHVSIYVRKINRKSVYLHLMRKGKPTEMKLYSLRLYHFRSILFHAVY